MSDFHRYAADEILRDGGSIHIRAIRADDKQRLLDHFSRLSPRSIHLRFFGPKRRLSEEELRRFTELDFSRNAALVATLRSGAGEQIVGVGRYMSTAEHRAEVAFAVADEHQGRGIGTVLLEHLAAIARANGISELEADVLGENNQMLLVFRKSGLLVKRSIDAGVVHLTFPTDETEEFVAARLDRDLSASTESVTHILEPKSVAVIGAVDEPDSMAGAVLANLRRGGFSGSIHVVDPSAKEVGGFATASTIDRAVDLALIALPASSVAAAVSDCARAGVRTVAVLSSGFAEASVEGRRAQEELARLVRGSGMRLVGPNSLGIINTDPAVRLNAIVAGAAPSEGNVAMLVQSRELGVAILDYAALRSLGMSSFVSTGNKADVSGNDLVSFWMRDPRTAAIALYLESFGNPRRFARIAPRVARSKPIVVLKAGRSGVDSAADALFQQAGVIRTDTIEQMFDVLALLSTQPLPAGRRIGVVTNASGPGVLVADAIEAQSLELASLDPGAVDALANLLGRAAETIANPVDLGADATLAQYEAASSIVAGDACVDALVAIHIPALATPVADVAAAIARAAGSVPAEKPVIAVFIASREAPVSLHAGPRGRLPSYAFPENAVMALAAAEAYGRWRRRPQGAVIELDRTAESAIRAVVERVRAQADGPRWLAEADVATVLRAAGITYAEYQRSAAADAPDLAETIGYPLVVKAVAAGLERRSENECIVMGLESKDAVAAAVAVLRRRLEHLGLRLDEVLLQREYRGGIEAIVQVTADELFGPLVVCGLGGVLVEVLRDRAVRLPPVTDVDAAEMIGGLRSSRLLDGYRGVGPGDRPALEAMLTRVSAVIDAVPEIAELELSPIKVLAPGEGAVVLGAKIRL